MHRTKFNRLGSEAVPTGERIDLPIPVIVAFATGFNQCVDREP